MIGNSYPKDKKGTFNICLLGCSLTTGNRGVSALCASLVKIFNNLIPESNFYFLIGFKKPTIEQVKVNNKNVDVNIINYRLSPKSKLECHLFWIFLNAVLYKIIPINFVRKKIITKNTFLRTLFNADIIGDIRGGDSFSDIYGVFSYFIGLLPLLITILLNKKFILLPQTYGPYKTSISKFFALLILKKAELIFSRDIESINFLKKILKKEKFINKITFIPDVAFLLDPIKPQKINYELPFKINSKKTLIGINVSGLLYIGGYTKSNMFNLKVNYKEFIIKLINKMLETDEFQIILVPHTYCIPKMHDDDDAEACREILKLFKDKKLLNMVNGDYDQHEIKSIIGKCNFFIGSRMHSCIAAISQGIYTIGAAYSKKFLGVFNSVNLGDMVIDLTKISENDAINKIMDILKRNKIKSNELLVKIKKIQENIILEFKNKIL